MNFMTTLEWYSPNRDGDGEMKGHGPGKTTTTPSYWEREKCILLVTINGRDKDDDSAVQGRHTEGTERLGQVEVRRERERGKAMSLRDIPETGADMGQAQKSN